MLTFKIDLVYIILIIVGAVLLLAGLVFLFMYLGSKNSKKKKDKEISGLYVNVVKACGGIDNIKSASSIGSRLTLILADYSLINDEELKIINITGVFKTTQKVTLVIGEMAEKYANKINEMIKK